MGIFVSTFFPIECASGWFKTIRHVRHEDPSVCVCVYICLAVSVCACACRRYYFTEGLR